MRSAHLDKFRFLGVLLVRVTVLYARALLPGAERGIAFSSAFACFRSEDHGRPLNESQRTSAFTDWGKSMTAAAAAARLSPPSAATSPPMALSFPQTGPLVPVEPPASVEFFPSSRPLTGACLPPDVSRYSSSSLSAPPVFHVRRQFSEPVVRIVRPAVPPSECTLPVTLTAPPSPASSGAPETAGAQPERFLPVSGHTSLSTQGPPISQRPRGPDESELVGNGAASLESSLHDGLDAGKQDHPSGGSGLESRVSESSETAVLADASTAALSVGLDRRLSIEGQENRRCADDETRTAAALATAAAAAVTAVARAAKAAADAATAAAAEAAADAAPTAAAPLGELVKAMCGVHGTGQSIYEPPAKLVLSNVESAGISFLATCTWYITYNREVKEGTAAEAQRVRGTPCLAEAKKYLGAARRRLAKPSERLQTGTDQVLLGCAARIDKRVVTEDASWLFRKQRRHAPVDALWTLT